VSQKKRPPKVVSLFRTQPRKSPVKKGDRILFGKYSGTEVKIGGQEYLIMREDDVLGIID
jgi:co-chaperonin GroES (HSP10)